MKEKLCISWVADVCRMAHSVGALNEDADETFRLLAGKIG